MNPVDDAIAIWKAGVAAVEPRKLVRQFFEINDRNAKDLSEFASLLSSVSKIKVVGAGKAGAAMALGLEDAFKTSLQRVTGTVNIPEGERQRCEKIHLNAARPIASNFPTEAGVHGSNEMLRLFRESGSNDLGVCLISGGGSALLPAPAEGVTLEDKITVTKLLHACGATINEMNCIRKHLSRIKGGLLAEAFSGRLLIALIISDVLDDPLDVIASGPTVPDPTTFRDAMDIIANYKLDPLMPISVISHFRDGVSGLIPETPKSLTVWKPSDVIFRHNEDERNMFSEPSNKSRIVNWIVGSNNDALYASMRFARDLGYQARASNPFDRGDVGELAQKYVRLTKGPFLRPHAMLYSGETTVTLGPNPGKGGRNQEFVLAMLCELGEAGMKGVTILCAGTDGEDGPTDAAGAIGTEETLKRAKSLGLNPKDFLDRHDSYHFFEATGGLFKTGLTGTNVMDLGVILLT